MKKRYVKPQMDVHAIKRLQLLNGSLGSKMSVKIGDSDTSDFKYGGYVTEDNEEEIDPE